MGGALSNLHIELPPRVDVDEYPVVASVDGVSTSSFEPCAACTLKVRGISTASVRLERDYGPITTKQCTAMGRDRVSVERREMSFRDFMTKLQAGGYFRPVNDSFCEQVMFGPDDLKNIKTFDDFNKSQDKLMSVRVRKVSGSGGYSSDTKISIIPSVPFRFTFNGVDIDVKRMTMYHPCPVRIDNVQYDAVLSLNDPDDTDSRFILLLPLQASAQPDPKADAFFSKLVSSFPKIVYPQADASFDPVDIPTGSDWKLSDVFPSTGDRQGDLVVQNGFFAWRGSLPKARTLRLDEEVRENVFFRYNHKVYGWDDPTPSPESMNETANKENGLRKQMGLPPRPSPYPDGYDSRPQYILMAAPAKVGAYVMSAIHLLPATAPEHAIHPVPAKHILYKEYICSTSSRREHFDNKDKCNPFALPPTPPPITSEVLITIVLSVLGSIAMFIGVYFAVKYAAGPGSEIIKKIGQAIGKSVAGIRKTVQTAPAAVAAAAEGTFTQENPMRANQPRPTRAEQEAAAGTGLTPRQVKQAEAAEPLTATELRDARRVTRRARMSDILPKAEMKQADMTEDELKAATEAIRRMEQPHPTAIRLTDEERKAAQEETKKWREGVKNARPPPVPSEGESVKTYTNKLTGKKVRVTNENVETKNYTNKKTGKTVRVTRRNPTAATPEAAPAAPPPAPVNATIAPKLPIGRKRRTTGRVVP